MLFYFLLIATMVRSIRTHARLRGPELCLGHFRGSTVHNTESTMHVSFNLLAIGGGLIFLEAMTDLGQFICIFSLVSLEVSARYLLVQVQ